MYRPKAHLLVGWYQEHIGPIIWRANVCGVDPALTYHLPNALCFCWFCTSHICHTWHNSAVQSQKAVTAYFTSKQLLPFGSAGQTWCHLKGLTFPLIILVSCDACERYYALRIKVCFLLSAPVFRMTALYQPPFGQQGQFSVTFDNFHQKCRYQHDILINSRGGGGGCYLDTKRNQSSISSRSVANYSGAPAITKYQLKKIKNIINKKYL